MPFLDSLDLAKRSCEHLGVPEILTIDEVSIQNRRLTNAFDKLRRPELRRNVWRYATRRAVLRPVDTTTMILMPADWDAITTYNFASVVKDANGLLWQSQVNENLNNNPGVDSGWDRYFGPITITPWDSTQNYFAGELVYIAAGNPGGFVIFVSLQNSNTDNPATATAWSAATTYKKGDVISNAGSQWRSLIELNLNIAPADAPAGWQALVSYSNGQTVTGSDGFIYTSLLLGNLGLDPTTDAGVHWAFTGTAAWTRLPAIYPSSLKWLPIFGGMQNLSFSYPIGSGPVTQSETRNVYRLPAGFLREAPQDPKAGSTSFLGAPSGLLYNDWEFEGEYIVTRSVDPIVFRFVADISQVSAMDDMFCEGLAARMAFEECEALTQSTDKQSAIAKSYSKFMAEARTVNAIETGSDEPPEDDFIACRR